MPAGYGHITPSTNTGRAITIVYAIFGIPMFLILLADFGKLFTRGIKFLWALVRRVYYTGSCRNVRRTAPVQIGCLLSQRTAAIGPAFSRRCQTPCGPMAKKVEFQNGCPALQEVMKGVQLVYDFATFQRRPSQMKTDEKEEEEGDDEHREAQVPLQSQPNTPHLSVDGLEPGTPAPSNFEIDDEFNLPISVAIVILLIYIFVGATIYFLWETWGFFEAFYFVFISMSTIGFGDFVPEWLDYQLPTKANRVRFPTGSRAQLVGGFPRGFPVPPALAFRALRHTHLASMLRAAQTSSLSTLNTPLSGVICHIDSMKKKKKGEKTEDKIALP
ncbi:hypothetical protein PR048_033332 [Dryococelus australis]|uniref:Potassium channel domain-containing protein n=1 Tax=Dryococelus australis TaxID=614101 RepID=A0ABQ9G001_9NEOP|nr:hypothetical protein PR048_033332 [Dryococelus australis]